MVELICIVYDNNSSGISPVTWFTIIQWYRYTKQNYLRYMNGIKWKGIIDVFLGGDENWLPFPYIHNTFGSYLKPFYRLFNQLYTVCSMQLSSISFKIEWRLVCVFVLLYALYIKYTWFSKKTVIQNHLLVIVWQCSSNEYQLINESMCLRRIIYFLFEFTSLVFIPIFVILID